MNDEQRGMLRALMKNCEQNIKNAEDDFEVMLWENMQEGLQYVYNGGTYDT